MKRREFPTKVKVAAFKRANGRCEECTAALSVGKYHYDHIIADQLGGEPVLSNAKVLCAACHGAKTAKSDAPAIAEAKRRESAHVSARAAPKRPIKSAGFPKGQPREPKPRLPPRQLYADWIGLGDAVASVIAKAGKGRERR